MKIILLASFLVLQSSLLQGDDDSRKEPDWMSSPTRTVDNGYIVYVGHGEDSNAERARLKAEGAAIQDLANECSFPPKGARFEDSFDDEKSGLHKTSAKLGVEFTVCEDAKKAIAPGSVRSLANVPMTEELKRYQDLFDEPIAVADNAKPLNLPENGKSSSTSQTDQVVVNDYPSYYGWRQMVFYQKETVILAPATSYGPGAPETVTYTNNINNYTQKIVTYEQKNPAVKNSTQTWSTIPTKPAVIKPQNLAPKNPPLPPPKAIGQPIPKNRGYQRRSLPPPALPPKKKRWY